MCLATARHFDFGAKVMADPYTGPPIPEIVTMPETLWSAALQVMDPIQPALNADYFKRCRQNRSVTDVPYTLVRGIIDYLSEDLGCDHSVGICMCATIGVVQELNLALEGKLTCPRCGGEGFVWDDKAFEDAVRQTAAHFQISDKEARWECEMAGNVKCPECDSAGYVRMTGVTV